MTHVDERILEALDEQVLSNPELLAIEIDAASECRIRERCEVLANAGYVEPAAGEMYELTTWGRLYLSGDVDAELIRPTPAPRPPEAVRPRSWSGCV